MKANDLHPNRMCVTCFTLSKHLLVVEFEVTKADVGVMHDRAGIRIDLGLTVPCIRCKAHGESKSGVVDAFEGPPQTDLV
jgi:hypothetical protein